MVPGAHDALTTTESGSDYDFENFNPVPPIDNILINRLRKPTRNRLESGGVAQLVNTFKKVGKDKASKINDGEVSDLELKDNFQDYEANGKKNEEILPPKNNIMMLKKQTTEAETKQKSKFV